MSWVTSDFECKSCGHIFEELYRRGEEVFCPQCEGSDLTRLLSPPNLASYSISSPERKREILKTRSEKHTAKEVAKEPERWGSAGIARQQSQKNSQVGYTKK